MFYHMHKGDRAQWAKGDKRAWGNKKTALQQHGIHADEKPIPMVFYYTLILWGGALAAVSIAVFKLIPAVLLRFQEGCATAISPEMPRLRAF
jgi:hypothetical protein